MRGRDVFIMQPTGLPTNCRVVAWTYWMPVDLSTTPPKFGFNSRAVGKWVRYKYCEDSSTGWGVVGPGDTHVDASGAQRRTGHELHAVLP